MYFFYFHKVYSWVANAYNLETYEIIPQKTDKVRFVYQSYINK